MFAIDEAQVSLHLLVEQPSHGEQVRHALHVRPQVLARDRTQDAQGSNRRVDTVTTYSNREGFQ